MRDAYHGANGYPAIVTPEGHERIQGMLKRLDPVAQQARKGGRRSTGAFLLRASPRAASASHRSIPERTRGAGPTYAATSAWTPLTVLAATDPGRAP
jgi:hypothetical protein